MSAADYFLLRTTAPREQPGPWMDALPAWYRARLNTAWALRARWFIARELGRERSQNRDRTCIATMTYVACRRVLTFKNLIR